MRTLEGHLLAMLEATGLPSTLWGEAVLTAAYLWNCTESAALPPGKTPYEMVNNKKPDLLNSVFLGHIAGHRFPPSCRANSGRTPVGQSLWVTLKGRRATTHVTLAVVPSSLRAMSCLTRISSGMPLTMMTMMDLSRLLPHQTLWRSWQWCLEHLPHQSLPRLQHHHLLLLHAGPHVLRT